MSENNKEQEVNKEQQDSRTVISKKMLESSKLWISIVKDLTRRISTDDLKSIVNVQAEAISHRQIAVDEIKVYSVKIHKLVQKMKVLTKARFEFYATSYQVKTSGTEKLRLIDADLSEHQCFINELDEHVNFLRDTSKNLESINYSVKARIELANILGV
jgi:hypothetical protein